MKSSPPKITIVTTPIRPVATDYTPFGSLAIVNALRKAGYTNVEFYDIDGLRPSYDEVLRHIQASHPDILGISAVVSTAYRFTKRLSLDVKRLLPETTVVLGGNLAASSEILLRKTGVDFCVLGEGERIIVNFVRTYEHTGTFESVRGLVYRDGERLVNTGYEDPIPRDELYDIDWTTLERSSRIGNFILPLSASSIAQVADPRFYELHRRGKMVATLVASKGCVSRCTFCHRWDRGIRYIPIPILMERLRYLVDRYNVGFVVWGDENFGTDRRWLAEFCREIKKFDVLWRVSGIRVNSINPEYLRMMREAGCFVAYFGMETGSPRMLSVMEKNVKIEDNYNAIKWTLQEGLDTTIQLVLGMPGETPETIQETADFVAYASRLQRGHDPMHLSINYAQALPGTPLYEFARTQGLVGQTAESEEQYLLDISDREAADEATTLNFTRYPKLMVETWRYLITMRAAMAYIATFGTLAYRDILKSRYLAKVRRACSPQCETEADQERLAHESIPGAAVQTEYFNAPEAEIESKLRGILSQTAEIPSFWELLRSGGSDIIMVYPRIFYRLRALLPLLVVARDLRSNGLRYVCRLVTEYSVFQVRGLLRKHRPSFGYMSLRRILANEIVPAPVGDPAMAPLRRGR